MLFRAASGSDGVFCNGAERFVDGACTAGSDPCGDGQACTHDSCDESTGTCHHALGASCARLHQVIPICNPASAAMELVYTFTTSVPLGLEARSSGYDTVLHLRKEDPTTPICTPAGGAGQFCGTGSTCHFAADPMPDLVVSQKRLLDEILFDAIEVDSASCSILERCVGGTGTRRVMRFSVQAINQGPAPLTVPAPAERPDLFTFSPCHGHYHFSGFASYHLLDRDGRAALGGHKQVYCIGDSQQIMLGPGISCAKEYDCENQGIQAGWSDVYGNALDCQWLDITDLPAGDYLLQVVLNPDRAFEEVSFDNNTVAVPVTIPVPAP